MSVELRSLDAAAPAVADLTVEEAAGFLNVSPSFVRSLLADRRLPCHADGSDPRIRSDDLTAYKRGALAAQRRALEELAALDQELGLG